MVWENVASLYVIARNTFISEIFNAIVLARSFIVTRYEPCSLLFKSCCLIHRISHIYPTLLAAGNFDVLGAIILPNQGLCSCSTQSFEHAYAAVKTESRI